MQESFVARFIGDLLSDRCPVIQLTLACDSRCWQRGQRSRGRFNSLLLARRLHGVCVCLGPAVAKTVFGQTKCGMMHRRCVTYFRADGQRSRSTEGHCQTVDLPAKAACSSQCRFGNVPFSWVANEGPLVAPDRFTPHRQTYSRCRKH